MHFILRVDVHPDISLLGLFLRHRRDDRVRSVVPLLFSRCRRHMVRGHGRLRLSHIVTDEGLIGLREHIAQPVIGAPVASADHCLNGEIIGLVPRLHGRRIIGAVHFILRVDVHPRPFRPIQ